MAMNPVFEKNLCDIVTEIKSFGNVDTVFFIACGGSLGGFFPAHYLLQKESRHFRSQLITSNEFVFAPPASCGSNSIAVLCTMRGTKETCEALRTAHKLGAKTIGLYVDESDLSRQADYPIKYKSIADDSAKATEVNSNIALRLAFELLYQFENYSYYNEAIKAFEMLDDVYQEALAKSIFMAENFAKEYADSKVMYVMGAGASMGAAYIYSICNIMEMQCIHSSAINHGEYFHGPFEITNDTADFFVLKTAGRTRPMDERVIKFLEKYARRYYVLDSEDLGINSFDSSVKEYFNQSLLSPVLNNAFLRKLSASTGKDYLTRNYMWKVQY